MGNITGGSPYDAGEKGVIQVPYTIAQGGQPLKKASDANLQDAAKLIEKRNISKLATKYLGLSSEQIHGRDIFSVLKLWRDAIPGQGSKKVRWTSNAFISGSISAHNQCVYGGGV